MTDDKPRFTSKLTLPAGIMLTQVKAARDNRPPTAWRLARRNGELILQAGHVWTQGNDEYGVEWNDVPTVNLDEQEANR